MICLALRGDIWWYSGVAHILSYSLKQGGKVAGQIRRKVVAIVPNGNSEQNVWVLVELRYVQERLQDQEKVKRKSFYPVLLMWTSTFQTKSQGSTAITLFSLKLPSSNAEFP